MAEKKTESCHALVPYAKEVAPHYVQTKVLQPEDQQSIIAFGMTGHGKSSFLNLLLGADLDKPVFKTSTGGLSGVSSKTKVTQCVHMSMNGRRLALIDTPGFCDTHRIADNRDKEASLLVEEEGRKFSVNITKAFVLAGRKVSAFIFVYRPDTRFSLEMSEQLKFLEAINFPWEHCILVMTHGDQVYRGVAKEKWYKKLDAELAAKEGVDEQLKSLIQRTTPRYMFVDNRCRDKKYLAAVMERFLGFMREITGRHGPYDNIHFTFFHIEHDREFRSAYKEAIQDASLDRLTAEMKSDFKQLALIGHSLVAKQEEFIKNFRSVIDMVGKKTFTPIVAAATSFGVAAIAAGAIATIVGTALIPVTFGSSAFAVAVGIGSIAGGATVAAGGVGAAAGIPLIKKLKDRAEVKQAQRCLDETTDVVKRFYAQYKLIMGKINEAHPNAVHSLFAHFATIHIHESTVESEDLFETAQELGVFYSLRNEEKNPLSESRVSYTLPVSFSLLASTMNVAQTVGTTISATHVSKGAEEIDATLLRECERTLQKEFNTIKALCITKEV